MLQANKGDEIWYYESITSVNDYNFKIPKLLYGKIKNITSEDVYHNSIEYTYYLENGIILNNFTNIYTNELEAIKHYNISIQNRIDFYNQEIKSLTNKIKELQNNLISERAL